MSDNYPEAECYECGRLKTRLIWNSRCVTCTVQKLEANLEENDNLRSQLAALEEENAALKARVVAPDLPSVKGVCVDAASPNRTGVIVFFERELTTDELRKFHELLATYPSSSQQSAEAEAQDDDMGGEALATTKRHWVEADNDTPTNHDRLIDYAAAASIGLRDEDYDTPTEAWRNLPDHLKALINAWTEELDAAALSESGRNKGATSD